jgi:hypothetical protein
MPLALASTSVVRSSSKPYSSRCSSAGVPAAKIGAAVCPTVLPLHAPLPRCFCLSCKPLSPGPVYVDLPLVCTFFVHLIVSFSPVTDPLASCLGWEGVRERYSGQTGQGEGGGHGEGPVSTQHHAQRA